jgi:SnoaL-like domain
MSQENVEIVGRWAHGFGHLTPEDMPQHVAEFCDPDCDYYPARKFLEARPCHGREQIERWNTEYLSAFARLEFAVDRLIAVGDDRVLVCANMRAEGRGSGANIEGDIYQCYWMRHGRVFRLEDHLTLAGAIHALGLSGETLEAAGLSE